MNQNPYTKLTKNLQIEIEHTPTYQSYQTSTIPHGTWQQT